VELPGRLTVVVLPLGYGRKRAGYTGTNKGFNAYAVRSSALCGPLRRQIAKTATIILSLARSITSTWKPPNPGRHARGIQKIQDSRTTMKKTRETKQSFLSTNMPPRLRWGMAIDLIASTAATLLSHAIRKTTSLWSQDQ